MVQALLAATDNARNPIYAKAMKLKKKFALKHFVLAGQNGEVGLIVPSCVVKASKPEIERVYYPQVRHFKHFSLSFQEVIQKLQRFIIFTPDNA